MKTLILFIASALVLLISSCNQNSPAPSNSGSSNNTTPPTPTSSMTATEAALVGDWIWDKKEQYVFGNLYLTDNTSGTTYANGTVLTHTANAGAHMILKSSIFGNIVTTPPQPQKYNADYGGVSGIWWVSPTTVGEKLYGLMGNLFDAGADPIIITLNGNTLIYQDWIPGQIPSGYKYYFHK